MEVKIINGSTEILHDNMDGLNWLWVELVTLSCENGKE
jgi:hypothetical protein